MSGLGEFGVDLELGVWIDDPEAGQLGLRSSINRRVLRSFAESGIAVAVRDGPTAGLCA